MKGTLAAAVAALALLVVSVSAAGPAQPSLLRLPRPAATGEVSHYGHVRTLTRDGDRYLLRFDPALWLSGLTARRAAREDTGSGDVSNDYYIRDETHRTLTFVVPSSARVTMLTRGLGTVTIAPAELAALLRGRNPNGRRLFDTAHRLGYWIVARGDTVRALDQQYQP